VEPFQDSYTAATALLRLGATLFFVAANGFFVAAEFALVKVRSTQLRTLEAAGSRRARMARHIHSHLNLYLSACQLGITLSSLILGWLAEPAVAQLLLHGAARFELGLQPGDPLVHAVALAVALAIVTFLHMTLGEQAPKIWAIKRAEATALRVAWPLQIFASAFRPFIWVISESSNGLLRLAGLGSDEIGESTHNIEELRSILESSAQAGHISGRQREIAENVFGMIDLEVRHILVPRVDVVFLSLQNSPEDNLRTIRESGHSRFPLCEVGLDSVIGIVHAKDVLRFGASDTLPDLRALARSPMFAPDTQPLARLIARMQRTRSHCAVVLDEHGSSVGLAFLEDALEEIVGPIRDEFDEEEVAVQSAGGGVLELPGSLALPEAADVLGIDDLGEEADTIGGYVVAQLGRLPRQGDQLQIGRYRVTVAEVRRRRITRLRFDPGGEVGATDERQEARAEPGALDPSAG
jgi:magnesium and cobalt exporter, CNNM family